MPQASTPSPSESGLSRLNLHVDSHCSQENCLRRSQHGDPLLICKFTRQLPILVGLFIINC